MHKYILVLFRVIIIIIINIKVISTWSHAPNWKRLVTTDPVTPTPPLFSSSHVFVLYHNTGSSLHTNVVVIKNVPIEHFTVPDLSSSVSAVRLYLSLQLSDALWALTLTPCSQPYLDTAVAPACHFHQTPFIHFPTLETNNGRSFLRRNYQTDR